MIGNILKKTWPLFLGMAFLMLGNGLQGTLISWRASFEGFSASTIGWIMTAYYLGFLSGSFITQKLVNQVGHIRVFAALASMASTAILVQIVFISPLVWFAMRLITGFCFAGAYVIVESWLNAQSSNTTRGRTLSLYMLTSFASMAGGQWLMKVADPAAMTLFILASVLLSIALVPMLITRIQAPESEAQENMGLRKLLRRAPAGVVSIFISSMAHGTMFGMGAVYAVQTGMNVDETVVFMSIFIAMGALSQWPIGWLSDQLDRRIVIVLSSVFASALCVALLFIQPGLPVYYLCYGLLGAMSLPLYSLGVAQTNDRLQPEQMSSASGTIVMVMGIGAILGPLTAGYVLNEVGTQGYFFHLGGIHFVIAIAVIYFIFQREAVAEEDQTQYQTLPTRPTMVMMETVAQEAEESMEPTDVSIETGSEK